MTTAADREWQGWLEDWQAEAGVADADAVRRDLRRLLWRNGLRRAGRDAVAVAMLVVFTVWAWRSPTPPLLVGAGATWFFVLAGFAFGWWNERGTWRPADRSTRAYAALARRQLARTLLGIRFGWWLLWAESAFFVPWIAWTLGRETAGIGWGRWLLAYGYLSLFALVFAAGLRIYRRRVAARLAAVEALIAGLDD